MKVTRKFYGNDHLSIKGTKPADLLDFAEISKQLNINIRVFELEGEEKPWALVYGKGLPIQDCDGIGLFKNQCFYIKYLEKLGRLWECLDCQLKFTIHNNSFTSHVAKIRCSQGKKNYFVVERSLKKFCQRLRIVLW